MERFRHCMWSAMEGIFARILAHPFIAGLTDGSLPAMREHIVTTSRYEWMFWDAAWRRESWPV